MFNEWLMLKSKAIYNNKAILKMFCAIDSSSCPQSVASRLSRWWGGYPSFLYFPLDLWTTQDQSDDEVLSKRSKSCKGPSIETTVQ